MAHQSLDHNEILNVRWATADPNPMAQKREVRRIEEQAAEAVRRALPQEFVDELEGRTKRQKVESGFGLAGYDAPDDIHYASKRIEAEEERLMIEAQADQVEKEEESGIFSAQTVAALKRARAAPPPKKEAAVAGPLVEYGSDSE
jgi:hypothetical protein